MLPYNGQSSINLALRSDQSSSSFWKDFKFSQFRMNKSDLCGIAQFQFRRDENSVSSLWTSLFFADELSTILAKPAYCIDRLPLAIHDRLSTPWFWPVDWVELAVVHYSFLSLSPSLSLKGTRWTFILSNAFQKHLSNVYNVMCGTVPNIRAYHIAHKAAGMPAKQFAFLEN